MKNDLFVVSTESQTRWSQIGQLSSHKNFVFETDDLVHYDDLNDKIFYIGRKTLTQKRFGIMINLEYIEQVILTNTWFDKNLTEELNDSIMVVYNKVALSRFNYL